MSDVTPPSTPFGEPLDRAGIHAIESATDFWNRKPQLQLVYHAAMDERISPWGLLGALMVHRLSHIDPTVVLVKANGKEGPTLATGTSLNAFVGLVGKSGGGKSVTFRLASELIPPKDIPLADGTGQGIVKSFAERKKVTKDEEGKPLSTPYMVTRFHRHSLTLHAPEVATLNAEFAREGSKTGGMMRSLWVGETVGMTNADSERNAVLPANMARLGGIWGVQPHNATAIMSQADDGTPQRFLWVPVRDRRRNHPEFLTNVAPPPPMTTFPFPLFGATPAQQAMGSALPMELRDDDPLPSPTWVHWSSDMAATVSANANAYDELMDAYEDYDELPPEVEAEEKRLTMAAHVLLMRIKLASQLGFMWGNAEPDNMDWYLSGALLELSMGEAAGVWKVCETNRIKEAAERGHTRGIEQDAADVARNLQRDTRIEAVASSVYTVLARERGCTEKGMKRHITASKRAFVRDALRYLEDQGRATYDGNTWRAVYNGRSVE